MLTRVIDAARQAGVGQIIVVLGPDSDGTRADLPADITVAIQPEPRGTGDAVLVALPTLSAGVRRVAVLGGDTPLVTGETIRAALDGVPAAPIVLVGANLADPRGYGRVVLGEGDSVLRIVEEADANAHELASTFVNGMIFAFDATWLREALPEVQPSASGEIYLTALVQEAAASGRPARAVRAADPMEIVGVNTRAHLAMTEAAARARVLRRLMEGGVTIIDPASTYVDEWVRVEPDVVIYPQTYLRGQTIVERDCVVGPGADILDCHLREAARVSWSVIEAADIGPRVRIGPHFRVRAGTVVEADAVLGSFGEVKNSRVGERTQMHHFSYLGDAVVGPDVNIGAGSITCNFDGVDKHQTTIGAGVFVGSDSLLVAPITLGDGSMTGAGAVVTRDVAPGDRVVGVPARSIGPRSRAANKPAKPDEDQAPA
jgi:bifunctional UDP-N-acetylglucosamine pyrophosphorylase / glucosamine-1-phosphate N-acetyltransferase